MGEKTPERFTTCTPVPEDVAADEALLAEMERRAADEDWRWAVATAGGEPVGEPEVSREPNPTFGMAMDDSDVVDPVRFHILARGWAVRRG